MSTQYAPRTHLATIVANVVLFLSDVFGLVPLLVGDFTVPAIEASDRFKILYSKNLWDFFFAESNYTFTCTGCFGFHLLHSRKLPHACHRILRLLLFGVMQR